MIHRERLARTVLAHDSLMRHAPMLRRCFWPRPPFDRKSVFVHRHLDGLTGIEIGASAHNDYGIEAINVDRYGSMDTHHKQAEWDLCGRKRPVDVVAPGDRLPFPDNSVDFVFSSHVLEHIPDPIRALVEWIRVARHKVVAVVPHRDRNPYDCGHELTSIDELERRHETHFSSDEDTHFSVWTLESFLAMCDHFGFIVVDQLDPDDKVGNGFVVAIDPAGHRPR